MSTPWFTEIPAPCSYCGGYHAGICPRVKSIEYHEWGGVKRVEFHDSAYLAPSEAGESKRQETET